ncbi:hypothetical protein VDF74_20050, partial [Xanthomonas campestris pv. raphani]|uniref:hypothetical protein n=1 Tax=Xanthomonas campestris TaxID=339 RepID=UPI002B23D246
MTASPESARDEATPDRMQMRAHRAWRADVDGQGCGGQDRDFRPSIRDSRQIRASRARCADGRLLEKGSAAPLHSA